VIEGVDEADTKPSAVGAKIAETLSKKIAALVILMVTCCRRAARHKAPHIPCSR
jgi:hypothetical protein